MKRLVVFDQKARQFVALRAWSPRYWVAWWHFRLIDAFDLFRAWKFWWRHNIVAFKHCAASPSCAYENARCVEYRWEPERGGFFYCTSCLRRVGSVPSTDTHAE